MTAKGTLEMSSMSSSTSMGSHASIGNSAYSATRVRVVERDSWAVEPYSAEAGARGASITAARGITPAPGTTPARGIRAASGSSWLHRLRSALRDERFVLHYQPIACVRTGKISHYEALVRLVDESDGSLIAPNLFLPVAERHGLIGEIDRLVVRRVLAEMNDHDTRVAVNLSALSASDPDMLGYVERELARHGIAPARLLFEITETAAISDIDQAKALCHGLQALGCAVALDDFGAGFGSFYYVKHLPFSYLKIDGDFIRELVTSPRDQLLVRALVQVARGMNMQTIAEFVGDQATMDTLRALGVDYAQGYEIGRPEPLAKALAEVACA
jgi:EAL domain-containing protein (putative c-di-GMP-specific phosphodiesterase class I)